MLRLLTAAVVATLALAAPAAAAPVLELHGGRVVTRNLRFAGATELPPPPRADAPAAAHERRAAARRPRGSATRSALDALLASGQIDQPAHDARAATLDDALGAYGRLTGRRRTELGAVLDNADAIAAAGALTPSRLEPLFQTIARNREWWSTGPLLSAGQRISFSGSQVIWQYYPGQGIELQMLANFGRVNALWAARRRASLRGLVDELVPLASDRGGFPAWEYWFRFGGGGPPWTSSISQGTAVQSLARAGVLLKDPALTQLAQGALALFERPAPQGVRRDMPAGPFYLIYTFAPRELVLNAHLQAVIGLFDVAQLTGDPRAQTLYASGESEARAIVTSYDTGHWSMYDQSHESDLSYHRLVTTFLRNLCTRSTQAIYCETAERFEGYETVPPVVRARTGRIRAGSRARLKFRLDKISRVGVSVTDARGRTVFATSAVAGRGNRWFTWSRPARPGAYTLRVSATDLAGNAGEASERALRILSPKRR